MIIALVAPYWLDQEPEQLRRAEACARTALSLDDHDAASHEAMGYVCQHQRKFDLAEMHFNRAMSLNPNDVCIAVDRANWLVRVDKPAEALQGLEAAMQRDPSSPTWLWEIRYNTFTRSVTTRPSPRSATCRRGITDITLTSRRPTRMPTGSMRRVGRSPHF
jgi:tetratricopeptide (TPR) repeat protein